MTDILTRKLAPVADAVESAVGSETVVLHLGTGTYFGLDSTGTEIWQLLRQGLSPIDICARLARQHGVDRATVERDVRAFLGELETHQMVKDG